MRYIKITIAAVLWLGLAVLGPASAASRTFETALETKAGPLELHIVQHASFVLRWNDRVIYVDPVGGAEAYAGLPAPDIVLLTHPHPDHLDPETLTGLDTGRAVFVMPSSVAERLDSRLGREQIVLGNGEASDRLGNGLRAVPMYNLPASPQAYHPKGWGNGYVLTLADRQIYISGDTEGTPEMRSLTDIDLAFVCMNLPYTMDTAQAADAVQDFAPGIVYPYHYRGQDVADFQQRLQARDSDIQIRLRDWYSGA
ncbi:MBL fold metallo-hydrolase [Salinisphaera sp. SPP-AMP-43]|uniref:MBL fold metallo-hydrolase n=1 Tax=Salinisphaera sp. SPP-AMP-43 TaxID=3121288 RepID=UPI003C6DC1F1